MTKLYILSMAIAAVVITGCTSTANYNMTLNKHHIDVAAGSFPIGLMHQFKEVCTSVDDNKPDCAVMDDTSLGQTTLSILTTGMAVGGATIGVYEGLTQAGQSLSPTITLPSGVSGH